MDKTNQMNQINSSCLSRAAILQRASLGHQT